MKRNVNKYYERNESGSLKLLEDYILSYAFRRGFADDPDRCPMVNLYVNNDLNFELYFVWHKFPNPDFIESYLKGSLPLSISKLVKKLLAYETLNLKDSYTDSEEIYVPDGIRQESINFNHNGMNQGIVLSPYYFREALMKTPQELIILKLYKEIEVWLHESFEKVKEKDNIH